MTFKGIGGIYTVLYFKITLDILQLQIMSKKKVLNGSFLGCHVKGAMAFLIFLFKVIF